MAPLLDMFPNMQTKQMLASEEELAPYKNFSSRMAAIDYTVCLHSEYLLVSKCLPDSCLIKCLRKVACRMSLVLGFWFVGIDIFNLIVGTFNGLSDTDGLSFRRIVVILETLAEYRSCVVMLDLECDDLVNEMDDHPESVLSAMQTIMIVVLEEIEDVRDDLLLVILSSLGRNKSGVTQAARRLAMNVIKQCSEKLEASIKQILISVMFGDNQLIKSEIYYHEVIYGIYHCASQILSGVVPYLTRELL
ncbi:hypothetical protein Gotur_025884, partial [Gossypium turneri]